MNIIVGTPNNDILNGTLQDDLLLGLGGNDVLNGGDGDDILVGGTNVAVSGGTYLDQFTNASFGNSNGTTNWDPDWVETNDSGGVTAGQIRIDEGNSNLLRFHGGTPAANFNGAEITRVVDLSSATTATITYSYDADNLDTGEAVRVLFAADGLNYVLLNTIDGDDNGSGNHVLSGPFSATARIRFEVTAINNTNENVEIDNLQIQFSAVETLNGGNGNDTYSFSLGDGSDTINELATWRDRRSHFDPIDRHRSRVTAARADGAQRRRRQRRHDDRQPPHSRYNTGRNDHGRRPFHRNERTDRR